MKRNITKRGIRIPESPGLFKSKTIPDPRGGT